MEENERQIDSKQVPDISQIQLDVTPASSFAHKKPSTKRRFIFRFFFNKIMLRVTIFLVIVAAGLWSFRLYQQQQSEHLATLTDRPTYQTIQPDGMATGDFRSWKRVSPPKSDPVFAYNDTISDITVSVSQQPLPSTFRGDVANQVAELAKKFNATHKIDAGGIPAYVGTSAKGPQSVIFTKNGLLVLIKSQAEVPDSAWIHYIKSLS